MAKTARTIETREPPKPRASAVSVHRLDWCARAFGSASGYGNASEQIALALESLGTPVRLVGDPQITGIQNAQEIAKRVDRTVGDALVEHGEPLSWFRDPDRRTYGLTTCDADRLPLLWNAKLANVDEIWVPSPWCREVFEKAAPKPVYVVPFGVDAVSFSYSRRTRGAKLRFLHFVTNVSVRKGADLAILAFKKAFEGRDDVELVLRMTYPGDVQRNDPRIAIDGGVMTTDALAMYYRSFDALLAPSRSEGFGLVPLEAMATGMPAIFTDAAGMTQYRELGMPVSARPVPSTVSNGRSDPSVAAPWGRWFAPNVDELVDRLREVDTDYERVMAAAESDAAAIEANWSWQRTAAAIVARLNA